MRSPGRTDRRALFAIVAGLGLTVSLSAQARPGPREPSSTKRPAMAAHAPPRPDRRAARTAGADVKLIYDREVYIYPGDGRRDPFRPLVGADREAMDPRFEDLVLRGIIFSPKPGRSMALLTDPSGKIFRVREGDVVGNARIALIEALRVVFEVETFGVQRREQLELKSTGRGGQP